MTFVDPIGRREGRQLLGWHELGLSPRDMRDLMDVEEYPYPKRSADGIRAYLRRYGFEPHPSLRGPKADGADAYCESDRHPGEIVERRTRRHECPRCKVIRAAERRAEVRDGLAERVDRLRAMGGETATIAQWIEENVRVA